jgi:adenylyltransferase/sulfurtransferase
VHARFDAGNAAALVRGQACVIDATDGIATKFLINDLVVARHPAVHGGILRFQGQLMTILPGASACYRCLFGAPPEEGSAPSRQRRRARLARGDDGALQAAEAIRIVTGTGTRSPTVSSPTTRRRPLASRAAPPHPACPTCRSVTALWLLAGATARNPEGTGRRTRMPIQVRIPTPLRKFTGGAESVPRAAAPSPRSCRTSRAATPA